MRNKLTLLFCLTILPLFSQVTSQPNGFIENKGQVVDQKGRPNSKVKYLLNTNGLNVQLKAGGFSYDIYEMEKQTAVLQPNPVAENLSQAVESSAMLYHRVDVEFVNANQTAQLIPEGKSTDYDNYYNVAHAPDGILNVRKFQKVTYKNIYDNIDILFFIPEDHTKPLEYNFIINPGGNIADIQLRFKGAKTALVDNKIRMSVRFGAMDETLPLSWEETQSGQKEVLVSYRKIKDNVYGFQTAADIKNKTIIIDPTPIKLWGTYFNVNASGLTGHAYNIATDMFNNVYISGDTPMYANLATAGAVIGTLQGIYDGFVTKFDGNGVRLWGTYCGGSHYDSVTETEPKGNDLVILGWTQSTNMATPGAYDTSYNVGTGPGTSRRDCFIWKLDLSGVRLWGTYFGGEASEDPAGITIDVNNNILVAGTTYSINDIATPGTYKEVRTQPVVTSIVGEGFVAKFTPAGDRIWGTYYGLCHLNDIDTDSNANVFISGFTNETPFISTPGTHQPILADEPSPDEEYDAFLAKLDTNGQRIWGTYYGGYGSEYGQSVKVDSEDNIYISGLTESTGFISTPGAHQLTNAGGWDGFLAKFNQSGLLAWGTYYGGAASELSGGAFKVDIDANDGIFLLGSSPSADNIATPGSYSETKNGYRDCFIVKFNKSGQRLWGTYFGGSSVESSTCIALDHIGGIFVNGYAEGTDGHATPGAYHGYPYATPTPFLDKFFDCQSSVSLTANTPVCVGSTLQLSATGGTGYSWTGPNSFSSNLQNPTIPNATAANSGPYSCTVTGTTSCDGVNTIIIAVGDNVKPIPNVNPLPAITGDCNTTIPVPVATDNCAGNITATTPDAFAALLPGNYTIHWNYNDGNGNIETQTQSVTINAVALPVVASPQNFCIQQNATLASIAISGLGIKWYDAPSGGNLLAATTTLLNGTTYYASQTIGGCESLTVPVTVNVYNTPAPTGNISQSFCSTQNATLNDISVTGANIVWYASPSGTAALPTTALLGDGITYYATQTLNGCESVSRLAVTIHLINSLNANDYSETICDVLNDGIEIVDLESYKSMLISNPTGCTFDYYTSLSAATNQDNSGLVANAAGYNLNIGSNPVYVRITSPNSCHQIVRLDLTLVRNPALSIPDTVPICEGNTITVDAGPGFDGYTWSTGASTQSITVSQAGNYWVTITKNHGTVVCSATKNFAVVLSNIATITGIETQDWTDNENTITVMTSGYGIYEFSTDGIHYQDSNVFTGLPDGTYNVYVRDRNGCGTVEGEVFLLMYPKYFTPNGDGYHDTWNINFSYSEPGLKVNLFDRYGKFLKVLDHLASWDGLYGGHELPADDYWFVVTRKDGKEYRGHFALKR
jgi:gliding motility-associated-like protein